MIFVIHASFFCHRITKQLCYCSCPLHWWTYLSLSADIFIFMICAMIAVVILLLARMGSRWGLPSAMMDCVFCGSQCHLTDILLWEMVVTPLDAVRTSSRTRAMSLRQWQKKLLPKTGIDPMHLLLRQVCLLAF